jgi:hypothetical protein
VISKSSPPDPWRNGSASDSRSEGCVFDSRRVQTPEPNRILFLQFLPFGERAYQFFCSADSSSSTGHSISDLDLTHTNGNESDSSCYLVHTHHSRAQKYLLRKREGSQRRPEAMAMDPSSAAAQVRRSEEEAEAFFRAAPPLRDRDRVAADLADFVARHSAGK